MASTKSRPIRSAKPRIVKFYYRQYSEIEAALNDVKCMLTCASMALGKAQDTDDRDLGAKAWSVINSCVGKLDRLENDLDAWYVAHEHSPKGVHDGK